MTGTTQQILLGCVWALVVACLLVAGCMVNDRKVERDQLDEVNRFVNSAMTYRADPDDYWQSPFETAASLEGDCEDYAFYKQFLLESKYGIDSRVLLVLLPGPQPYHAIVEYDGMVLDNRHEEVQDIDTYTVLRELNR